MRRSLRMLWTTCPVLLALALTAPLMAQDEDDLFGDDPNMADGFDFDDEMGEGMEDMAEQMMEAMKAMKMPILEQAIKDSPRGIQAKVGRGEDLNTDELREVSRRMAVLMGEDPSDVDAKEDPTPEELIEANLMIRELQPKFADVVDQRDTAVATTPPADDADGPPPASLFKDFIHYIRIARHDLAVSFGTAWLEAPLTPDRILTSVEKGPYKPADIQDTLNVARKAGGEIEQVAKNVETRIEKARLDVARDPTRIRNNIEALATGLRAQQNAIKRLQQAGEYTAPHFLAALLNTDDRPLHPYVTDAMVAVGREIVQPICEAFAYVPPVNQRQIARVLSDIGYPLAVPYLKAVLETQDLEDSTRRVVEMAVSTLEEHAGIPADRRAAELFYLLAEDYYAQRVSLILHPDQPINLLWDYRVGTGLVPLSIPTPVYHDVMAMRAARRALELDRDMSGSLSLWIAANFRRENNQPEGAVDPSYRSHMRSPLYYATMAGPRHLQPVLQRALANGDAELALDAIDALRGTAGEPSLLNRGAEQRPLAQGLNFPDRRVRIESAFAIAEARPTSDFSNSQRVVPVLSEAIRQSGTMYAVVLAEDLSAAGVIADHVRQAGRYEAILGTSFDAVVGEVADAPGVDLIVVQAGQAQIENIFSAARQNVKLQVAPIVVLAGDAEIISLTRRFESESGVRVAAQSDSGDTLIAGIQQVTRDLAGDQLTDDQARTYALHAMSMLRELAMGLSSDVFHIEDGYAALLESLDDPREEVLLSAAAVVALLDHDKAQQALADVALHRDHDERVKIALMKYLAESARRFGPRVTDRQIKELLELVASARGALSEAAAQAHGALDLPTANPVELIVRN